MRNYCRQLTAAMCLLGMAFNLLAAAGWPPILTREERILNSGMNPSNCTWKAHDIRLWPLPEIASNGPEPIACFRKDFVLSAAPRRAGISLLPRPKGNYRVFVNGRLAADAFPPGSHGLGLRNLDLAQYLHAGTNVLTLLGVGCLKGYGFHVAGEGIVFGEDGSMTRLMTDGTWRGGWNLPAGWDQAETSSTNLPAVSVLPVYAWSTEAWFNPPYQGPIQIAPKGMSQPIFDEEKPVELAVTLVNGAANDGEQKSENAQRSTPNVQRRMNTEAPAFPINHKPLPILTYEIFDENSRKNISRGVVALKPEGKLDLAGTLQSGPLPQGAYRFRFDLMSGTNRVDRRDYEVACVGAIKQRLVDGTAYEDGMELKEVWSMDCTTEPKPGEFIAYNSWDGKGTAAMLVEEGPAGKYRAFSKNCPRSDQPFFAYRFKVKRLFVPHLAVIEWPDDAPRSFQVQLMEGTSMIPSSYYMKIGGACRGEFGVRCAPDYPRSNRMRKDHFIFWPNEEDAAVHVQDYAGPAPAAIARIAVYEILNDVPALKIAEPASSVSRRTTKAACGERMIGYHSERGYITAPMFYAGPLGAWFYFQWAGADHPEFYRNWYNANENQIKWMRFSGQNLLVMGQFMYNNTAYPSRRYQCASGGGMYNNGDADRDFLGLMARMYERNGLSLISGVEFISTPDLLAASPATEDEVRRGAPTLFCVGKTGKFAAPHGYYGGFNYFHPRVQDGILAITDELTALYHEYPAWKGIAFLLGRALGPMAHGNIYDAADEPLNWGYEDYTLDLFQKETGIKMPEDGRRTPDAGDRKPESEGKNAADPDRFAKRHAWLMANPAERDKWIDWRCAQYTKLYGKIRAQLVKARPDLTLYLTDFEPMQYNASKSIRDLNGHFDDEFLLKQVLKTFGFDVDALKKEQNIVISYGYLATGTRQSIEGMCNNHREYWELAHSQTWNNLFANDGRGGAYIWAGFTENGYHIPKGQWLFEDGNLNRQSYLWPPGPYVNDTFVNVLVRSNPSLMPHTWIDGNLPGGHLHEMRQFARAYRSLPNGKYERLTGNGLDTNLWVESTYVKGGEYAYAANPQWWPLDEVTLTFAEGVKVHDLIKDQPVKLKRGRWTFKLGPYDVQTFRVEGGQKADAGRRMPDDGDRKDEAGNPTQRRTSAVLGASVRVSVKAAQAVNKAMDETRGLLVRARAKEVELQDRPGWQSVLPLERMLGAMMRLKAAGDLAEAYELAASWPLEEGRKRLVGEALEAMPFLVLGPFGDPKDTDGAGKVMGNRPVVPDCQAMETPYLGELLTTNPAELAKNFQPDLGKARTVHPGQPGKWQETLSTYYLSFYGKCHSEPPLWMAAYAYTEIFSPVERAVLLLTGSDHALWVWVNDRLVLRHGGRGTDRGGQRISAPDQDRADVTLSQGWNRVLVKAMQRGETKIYFRLTDKNDSPLDDLKFRVPKLS